MDDIFVYFIDLPGTINEMVVPCFDGFTVYIDKRLTKEQQLDAYRHSLRHIKSGDFAPQKNVGLAEIFAHEG